MLWIRDYQYCLDGFEGASLTECVCSECVLPSIYLFQREFGRMLMVTALAQSILR